MSTTEAAQPIAAHGAVVEITAEGVDIRRSAMAQTLPPSGLSFRPAELRGWYHHAPSTLSPGWIQFSLADPPPDAVNRPVRSFAATRGAANVVCFAPGQLEEFTGVHHRLTHLQAGYPLEDVKAPAEDVESPSAPASAEPPAASPAEDSSPRQTWQRVATPDTVPEADPTADANNPIFGENITLTGDFAPYDKGEVWDMIADAGATVGKNVTKKTTVLVIGEWGSVTSKEKRARELQDKGQEITLWSFDEFLTVLGKTRRQSVEDVKGTSAPF